MIFDNSIMIISVSFNFIILLLSIIIIIILSIYLFHHFSPSQLPSLYHINTSNISISAPNEVYTEIPEEDIPIIDIIFDIMSQVPPYIRLAQLNPPTIHLIQLNIPRYPRAPAIPPRISSLIYDKN
jgi:hypothetical protein